MSIRLNEDAWKRRLSAFVNAQEGLGGVDVQVVERAADGTYILFRTSRKMNTLGETFFNHARIVFGPCLTIEQRYDAGVRDQRVFFEVHAPSEQASSSLLKMFRARKALLDTKLWPLPVYIVLFLVLTANLLYASYLLHEHTFAHEEPVHTLLSFFTYHIKYYVSFIYPLN